MEIEVVAESEEVVLGVWVSEDDKEAVLVKEILSEEESEFEQLRREV